MGIFHILVYALTKFYYPFYYPLLRRVKLFHALDVLIGILGCEVGIDAVDGIGVAPTALAHCSQLRPTEMVSKGCEAVAQTMHTDFGQSVLFAQAVDKAVHGGGIGGYQSALFVFNYII